MLRSFVSATLILLAAFWHYGYASRILGVFPTPSISHQIVFRALTLALRERGHQLVVVTPDPVNDPMLTNYTEIDLHFLYADTDGGENWIETLAKERWTDIQDAYLSTVLSQTELILDHPELKKLYAPNNSQKFNLMMIEMLYYPALLPLATRFDVPVVGITSLGLSLSIHYAIGNPIIPSHSSNWDTEEMIFGEATFWQRLKNFIWVWKFLYKYRTRYMPAQQALARKYFGNDIPDISDIEKNVSVVFVNQQTPISYLRPNIPKVIDIGGFHIAREIKPLPKDLQKILDDSTQGFIYMSLGSNIKSVMLSDEVRREFIAAFSELPYTVIWKFEDDFLANKPENVIIMKWTPQQSILAHPNLKVFIYQGGLQSTEEAVSHGIPVIGLPVFTDQHVHANKMVSLGVGKKLNIHSVNRHDILEAIRTVVFDTSYKRRMIDLRNLLKDKPYDSLKNAIWWTEHVIRHKGASHLQSTTVDEPWYQRQDMDIVFVISTGFVITSSLAMIAFCRMVNHIRAMIHPISQKVKIN
ncbi:UDP-glycosyltransferase UGT5-like isoform X1 [Neodiprion virginianus]|uniref:UDP-glycosyltransferase UGT5-like isoform X1 n=2 Tax=Neodiprion virginianus TaxID=2961670 RepID=UPI001EE71AEB|nr:UDP-glycosyltransferase UGT5-like isoform X1 [Neodiprion virginianus]XP_046630108.1 UDP-glycosyltransferase UGT5-like isoform X1 [Neodiprion virginianus]XP_046630118.1 UDP-glycosyltransferase UGT5-like isoform X1 [Neodiprion virginianus]XP_046630124.1 UDP-glycosyltransferase UGT5-like isoform X1 [Neodiprion virginianus]